MGSFLQKMESGATRVFHSPVIAAVLYAGALLALWATAHRRDPE
ncbi:MAG: hypothetical protein ACR2GU_11575 [Rubrobacteraceae bacterium]